MVGVGLLYNGSIEPERLVGPARLDHVSVIPERFWIDEGRGAQPRFHDPVGPRRVLDRLGQNYPLTAHGLGLSIASACFFDREHLQQLRRLDREVGFQWISEHLAAFRVDHGSSTDHHAGVQIPMPWGQELLDLVVNRVDEVQQVLARPILLENGVEFTPVHDPEFSELEFWVELHERTKVGILLDLHNLHVNEVNLGWEPLSWIRGLPANAVREIHVAGGNWIGDTYFDSHSDRSPTPVLELLQAALATLPEVRAVTFEFHESYIDEIGAEGVAAEIATLRSIVADASTSASIPAAQESNVPG